MRAFEWQVEESWLELLVDHEGRGLASSEREYAVKALVTKVVDTYGGLDVAFNDAGIAGHTMTVDGAYVAQ